MQEKRLAAPLTHLEEADVGDAVGLVGGALLLAADAVQTLGVLEARAVDAPQTLPCGRKAVRQVLMRGGAGERERRTGMLGEERSEIGVNERRGRQGCWERERCNEEEK